MNNNYSVGSLVKSRGREWVVLPASSEKLLVLRPLGGSDDEITGIHRELEEILPATFDLPDPTQVGDYRSARLLRDAVRLGFRSSAGPFRSFARLAFEPRPYQLVPLLMALKLDPVRMLIADDVGIGKTIESGLVARELLDRNEIQRLAVLCPPALAEQWQAELENKFHIAAELVLPSTAARLERDLGMGESIFEHYPFVVVSLDFIKSDRHREDFLRLCPELVIVDEAHTCAFAAERGGRHQRYQLVRDLAANPERHVILVTGTPHSGNENAFRSLLGMLDRDFDSLPEDLTGGQHERQRKRLVRNARTARRRINSAQRTASFSSGCWITPARAYATPEAHAYTSACVGGRPWRCCAPWLQARRRPQPPCVPAPSQQRQKMQKKPMSLAGAPSWTW
jgi:hypothetical protein